MKRGQLIIIYFIVYVSVALTVFLKLVTLELARRELLKIDTAIELAGDKTARALTNHIYEENPEELLCNTFIYTYSIALNEAEENDIQLNKEIIDSIYIGINGEIVTNYNQLMEVKDSDSLAIYIVLKDLYIYTPFRSFVISREYYKEIER